MMYSRFTSNIKKTAQKSTVRSVRKPMTGFITKASVQRAASKTSAPAPRRKSTARTNVLKPTGGGFNRPRTQAAPKRAPTITPTSTRKPGLVLPRAPKTNTGATRSGFVDDRTVDSFVDKARDAANDLLERIPGMPTIPPAGGGEQPAEAEQEAAADGEPVDEGYIPDAYEMPLAGVGILALGAAAYFFLSK